MGNECPCHSGKKYAECCKPYHDSDSAPTPLQLMRSRYSAYALGLSEYIINTTHPKSPYFEKDRKKWRSAIDQFCRETRFLGLEIHAHQDDWVSFTAHLEQHGKKILLQEKSHFQKVDGKWLYVYGKKSTDGQNTGGKP